ncbi:MAG: hypothetical protein IJV35_02660 [Neisseriaceae bacterium]|nr:hypothetical protein [Neisseriaceae bacterium]
MPFITYAEVITSEYPWQVQIEVRNACTHLSRSWYFLNSSSKDGEKFCLENLRQAETHCQRAILDLCKFNCIAVYDEYKEYKKDILDYVNRWLWHHKISGGEYAAVRDTISKLRTTAVSLYREAKAREELEGSRTIHLYCEATKAHWALWSYLQQHKALFEDIKANITDGDDEIKQYIMGEKRYGKLKFWASIVLSAVFGAVLGYLLNKFNF